MLRLVVLLSLATLSLACAPKTSTTAGAGGGSGSSKKAKREVVEAQVIVATRQNYDPEMTKSYMGVVRSAIEVHAKEQGVIISREQIRERAENIGGKFAVTYTIFDVDCTELRKFVSAAKESTVIIDYVTVTCGEESIIL
ncbi:hypothetical protein TELCIR_08169 [Teladorsagia circumcincta]|uniref:Peptidase inhibitor I9 n=1 Tax=Teladorsagia circumcincta TaxID=45464 RepID=A0A2G9UIC0_TELCI|nr:hypothetical protein TELCIR_08169 [Teladorsagia circumcincta]